MASNVLTWQDNATNEASFEVERKDGAASSTAPFAKIGTTAPNVVTFTDGAVAEGATYAYRVRAVNATGPSAYSNVAERTVPLALPAAPSNLVVTGGA